MLTFENAQIARRQAEHAEALRVAPFEVLPWLLRPCRVRVLLVADGGLDFSDGGFGLSTFVSVLQAAARHYVDFELTIAHLSDEGSPFQVMQGAPGIARSIKEFRFDEPDHFLPDMYDQVWLFGIETNYHSGLYSHRQSNQARYPAGRLGDAELAALTAFMNRGGGLFATGDHGELGVCLSGSIPRARSMRLWGPTSKDPDLDEVSMGGPRRNDTNRIGHDAASQFDDQSDDVPQEIQPRLYSRRVSPFFRVRFPHPLLCGPAGVIRVLPDHPHEGECVAPADLTQPNPDGSDEYPPLSGGVRLAPEVIATATVPAGNTAGTKLPTQGHSYGVICAYDGHRAEVGRVVTDATWHHYVNINLVGDAGSPDPAKRQGFLATPAGQAHLENVKAYYRNIALWISPAASHRCFRRKLLWWLLHHHRVMEAVFSTPDLRLDGADVSLLFELGAHARDVLGRSASRCQSYQLVLDLLWPELPDLIPEIDPWWPVPPVPGPPPLPWVDPTPLLDVALGGALVALREAFPFPTVARRDEVDAKADALIDRGAKLALRSGVTSLQQGLGTFTKLARVANTP